MAKKATLEDLQQIIRDLGESQKETDQQIRELRDSQKETDRQMKETDRRLQQRQQQLDELFTGQWGKLMESLVEGDLIKLLKERNIQVDSMAPHGRKGKRNGEDFEFDIIAINGSEIVVVEVKTTLKLKNVDHFIAKLQRFTYFIPEHKDKKIYGAVAYLKANESSDSYSEKQGLFVIRATGSSASISNPPDFKPKVFGLSQQTRVKKPYKK